MASKSALDQLMPLVYGELRRMADRYMRAQSPSHTLQTTALIHEAYLRLAGDSPSVGKIALTSLELLRKRCAGSWWITRAPGRLSGVVVTNTVA